MESPLFLTGMMGCGKTTVGRVLARELGVTFIDLDTRIEHMFGATVSELFARRGESGFREAEQLALCSLTSSPGFAGHGVVVATGGGAVLHEASRRAMDRAGVRVLLDASEEELVRRLRLELAADPGARPLLQGSRLQCQVAELRAARDSIYRAGALCIDANGDPVAVAASIVAALGHDPGVPTPGTVGEAP